MNVKEYLGDIIGGSLMVSESRVMADTLLQQPSEEQWKHAVIEQNILQKNSPQTAIRYARTLRWRLEPLGADFMRELVEAEERVCIQMLLLALLLNSPVLVDFMKTTITDARRTYQPSLDADAWSEFYQYRIQAHPELGKFSESSIKKMGNNAIKILADAGYLNSTRGKQLQPVYLLPEVKSWLQKLEREDLEPVMECTL
ncbi:DUF1819 family protein [Oceanisphaera sp. IT1-181]|uniref:DUF1819 family protein n=1 Tax=Oceanisphaera sp. IT1-181 TaxID=3081199 RepID=UPI0029CA6684|nr:DUF1819 family protein [Oceanisphaera sp. IT1-181]